jgi:hypothetical protein
LNFELVISNETVERDTKKQRDRETKRLRVSEVVGRSDGHNYKFKRKERYIIGQKTKCKDTMIQ